MARETIRHPVIDTGQFTDVKPAQVIGLDVMRLIAALAVVMYHYADQISVPGADANRFSLGITAYPEIAGFVQFGWMGVPAFFVISGFVIAFSASAATASSFLSARILRLAPAVWICAPISAVCIVLSGQNNVLSVLGRLFNSLTFFPFGSQIDGVYWTLSIEVFFYLTVFILLAIGRFSLFSRYIYVIAIVSSAFNILLSLGYDEINVLGKWTKFLLISHGCEFALGAIAYKIHREGWLAGRFGVLTIAVIGTFAQTTPLIETFTISTPVFIWTAFLLTFAATISTNDLLARSMTESSKHLVREIGKATYPLYLIHQVVGAYIIYLLITLGLHRYAALILALCVIFLITAAVSSLEPKLRELIKPRVMRLLRLRPADRRAEASPAPATI